MKAALRKKTHIADNRPPERYVSSATPVAHERLAVSIITKSNTVDQAVSSTISEAGEPRRRFLADIKKSRAIDIPRSRSPSPVSHVFLKQAAILNPQAAENNNIVKLIKDDISYNTDPSPKSLLDALNISDDLDSRNKAKTSANKLRHIINELIDTEDRYVNDLKILMTTYLLPLKRAALVPDEEIDALISNIKDITQFQNVFLDCLVDAKQLNPEFDSLDDPNDFRRIVFSIGSSFLFHMDTFNIYSTFCAVHSRVQHALRPDGKADDTLQLFLESRKSTISDTPSLDIMSYLIKPMQRILKYPLLIREMKDRFDPESDTHYHLKSALTGMQKVANHINDMMKVHEQYGNIFNSLLASTTPKGQKRSSSTVTELTMDDLIMYNSATWLNSVEDLGRVKRATRGPDITVLVFRPAIVLICTERIRTRRLSLGSLMAAQSAADDASYKRLIPISSVEIRDGANNADANEFHPWELTHTSKTDLEESKKLFKLSCSSAELKNAFVKTIRQTVHEHNRKKILKDAGKQLAIVQKISNYSSGGKRHEALKTRPGAARRL